VVEVILVILTRDTGWD